MESTVSVFATSDDNYAPYVATTIASIMLHTQASVRFYVIDCGISEFNKNKIKREENFFPRVKIEFVEIDVDHLFSRFPAMIHLSVAMYGKYLISFLKPSIERIIYTDVDVSFTGDILDLWNESLDGFVMGAVPSQRYRHNNNYFELKDKLGIDQGHVYFMSGLMLIDCLKWRNENITEKLLKKTIELVNMPDQEVLNVLFSNNRYKQLDAKYCVIYKIFKEYYTKEERKKYKSSQVIVHYPGGGASKPWNNLFLPSAHYFERTIKYTAFKKEIINNQLCFLMHSVGKILKRIII